jgi:LPS sulfotransferase NodH
VTFGELFRNYDRVDWAYPGYQQTDRMMEQMQGDPVAFMEQSIFRPFPGDIRAVGFKIFYYHARGNGWERVWDHLQTQTTLRVLHIKRRNLLKTHLSRRRAAQTDVWTDTSGSSQSIEPITLDYDECLADFRQTRAWEEEYDARLADHPRIEIIYEDLAGDYETEMRRIQDFLGVPYRRLEPNTYRQSNEPLHQAIANYDELRARFSGTPWEAFFES